MIDLNNFTKPLKKKIFIKITQPVSNNCIHLKKKKEKLDLNWEKSLNMHIDCTVYLLSQLLLHLYLIYLTKMSCSSNCPQGRLAA